MAIPEVGDYWIVRLLFRRGLAFIYLLAFLAAATQFRALAGEDGLLPIDDYLARWSFRERPSLFYLVPDDRVIGAAAWAGVGLSALALVGAPGWLAPRLALPASVLLWGTLWALYLSFVNAGQTFYGFGWESMLLETGALAIFLGAGEMGAPAVVVWLLRWVLFRNMFGAGLIKIRGDDCWRDLTCMNYHYETQPMPNPVSWFAHRLPDRFHRVEVLGNHVVELFVPFLYFGPPRVAAVAGAITVGFQGWLMLTGNFAFLNFLTIVMAGSLFADAVVTGGLPLDALAAAVGPLVDVLVPRVARDGVPALAGLSPWPLAYQVVLAVVVVLVVALSYYPVKNLVSSRQAMNRAFDPFNLVNTYGAFGSITKTRYEVVVQGTDDEVLTADTEWETYEFPGKPTDPSRRPPQWAPYHLRLDWQLWFAAMTPSPTRHPWFVHLCAKLLAGDDATRSLLRHDPFPEDPPRHVRALRYRYEFTDYETWRETGRWWDRERVGTYFGPVSLDDSRFRLTLRRRGWDVPTVDGKGDGEPAVASTAGER
ncbi:MAG: lipase maturation factor family protein [Halobacteriales archaeon]